MSVAVIPERGRAVAILQIDSLRIVLPQSDIPSLESMTELVRDGNALRSAGWIPYRQKKWPVYCLSDRLEILDEAPASRRACAMMSFGAGYMGILCNDIVISKDMPGRVHELPVAMKRAASPVLFLAEMENGLACLTTAQKLTSYVDGLIAAGG